MTTPTLRRIERAGRWLLWFDRALILFMPVAITWLLVSEGPLGLVSIPPGLAVAPLTFPRSLGVIAVGLLTPAAYVVSLVFLHRLFGLYARGIVFSPANITAIRRTGYTLVAIDFIAFLQSLLTGPVMLLTGAIQKRAFLSVEFRVSMLIVGLFTVLISRVMDMGRELHENDQFTI